MTKRDIGAMPATAEDGSELKPTFQQEIMKLFAEWEQQSRERPARLSDLVDEDYEVPDVVDFVRTRVEEEREDVPDQRSRRALEGKRRVLDEIDKLIEADPCEGMPGYQRFWDLRWVVFGFAAEYEDHPDFHDDYRYQR
ncbi:hypothetical protein [Saccharopolyspora phatthalungensis]|uniref:Uncharacterized protein n=1 Tax=Saccharopolyspora phatthalungensis TaxID=664693 RepID=A0A840Q8I4_9PSEU|nr:hypothetical protein [Saccharopolyspora phatthalungensis]MBB5154929.1 hypothetical protein [Saccharopolyspora phatthalungensis]